MYWLWLCKMTAPKCYSLFAAHCLQLWAALPESCCSAVFLTGSLEREKLPMPTHHFPSLCVLVFCFPGWGSHSIKNHSPGCIDNIKVAQSGSVFPAEWTRRAGYADETFMDHNEDMKWFLVLLNPMILYLLSCYHLSVSKYKNTASSTSVKPWKAATTEAACLSTF